MIDPISLNISCPSQTMLQQSTLTSKLASTPPSKQPPAMVYVPSISDSQMFK